MACEPKRISELTRTKTLNPEDLFTLNALPPVVIAPAWYTANPEG